MEPERSGAEVTTAPAASARSRPARNALFALVAESGAKVATFAWTIIAARELTQREFGSLNLALSIALILAAIAEMGFDPLLVQRTAREPEHASRYFSHAVGWQTLTATTVFGTGAIIPAAVSSSGTTRVVMVLVFTAIYLDVFGDTIRAMGAALHRQAGTSLALIVQRVATAAIAVPVLLAGGGLEGFAIAFLASHLLGGIAHLLAVRTLGVRARLSTIDRVGMRSFWQGSLRIGISGLLLAALFRIDAVLVAAIEGDAALGAYSAAYKLFETALFVAFALTSALLPLMSERAHDPSDVRSIYQKAVGALSLFFVPYATICLVEARGVLEVIFGDRYGRVSADALRWLAFAPAVFAAAFATSAALVALQRTEGMVVAAVSAVVTNIGLNLLLIPELSIEGAAIATLTSYLVQVSVLMTMLARVGGGPPKLARPLAPAITGSAALAAMLVVLDWSAVLEIAVGVVAYAVVWVTVARIADPDQLGHFRDLFARATAAPPPLPSTGYPAQSSSP